MFTITETSIVAKDGSKPVWYLWQQPPKGAKLLLTRRQVKSEIEAIKAAREKADLKDFQALKAFASSHGKTSKLAKVAAQLFSFYIFMTLYFLC